MTKRASIRQALANAAHSLAWAEKHAADPNDIEAIGRASAEVDRALVRFPEPRLKGA